MARRLVRPIRIDGIAGRSEEVYTCNSKWTVGQAVFAIRDEYNLISGRITNAAGTQFRESDQLPPVGNLFFVGGQDAWTVEKQAKATTGIRALQSRSAARTIASKGEVRDKLATHRIRMRKANKLPTHEEKTPPNIILGGSNFDTAWNIYERTKLHPDYYFDQLYWQFYRNIPRFQLSKTSKHIRIMEGDRVVYCCLREMSIARNLYLEFHACGYNCCRWLEEQEHHRATTATTVERSGENMNNISTSRA